MSRRSRLWTSVCAGALAGAAVALLLRPADSESLDGASRERTELRDEVTRLRAELADVRHEFAALRVMHEQWREHATGSSEEGTPIPLVGRDTAEIRPVGARSPDRAAEGLAPAFSALVAGGLIAVNGPQGDRFVAAARDAGVEGATFLLGELRSGSADRRFMAAILAERLGDPSLVEPLAAAAVGDASPRVRRSATDSLAALEVEGVEEALIAVLDAVPDDIVVHLGAWRGLALRAHPATEERLETLLGRARAPADAELVVDTALGLAAPELFPALRRAFDHADISEKLRIGIVRTLARDPSGEWEEFVRSVAEDEKASKELRAAARELFP